MILGLAAAALALATVDRARAEAQLLIEASTGKVLHAEDVADVVLATLTLPERAMVSELDIRPTNP